MFTAPASASAILGENSFAHGCGWLGQCGFAPGMAPCALFGPEARSTEGRNSSAVNVGAFTDTAGTSFGVGMLGNVKSVPQPSAASFSTAAIHPRANRCT